MGYSSYPEQWDRLKIYRRERTHMHSPVISFIVPSYNYARYLKECLQSIFDLQGDYDFEVIVIDDASTDNTQTILQLFNDPRLKIITHHQNQGHAETMNIGLRLAKGKFIARIDADDRYRKHFLTSVMEIFKQHPEVAVIYGDVAFINSTGEITQEPAIAHHGGKCKGNVLIPLMKSNFICAPTTIVRAEIWKNVEPAPEWVALNDWYFMLMIARKHDFYYVNQVLADYRVHDQGHHYRVSLDKSEEAFTMRLFEKIFNSLEENPQLENEKQRQKNKIYSSQYLELADKYFGCDYFSDARRCYLLALRYNPMLLNFALLRKLIGTIIGRANYEFLKAKMKRVSYILKQS